MDLVLRLIILLFSAIAHEVAHGLMAERLGDSTARRSGRLTLNPIPHIDPFMSILLPLALLLSGSPVVFGAAKPVPINEFNLRDGRKDIALVALAGPLSNVILAILGAGLFHIIPHTASLVPVLILLQMIVLTNLLLAVFNMIPIPPLDGSKVFSLILPERDARAYLSLSSIGFMLIFALLAFPIGGFSLGNIVFTIVHFLLSLLGL